MAKSIFPSETKAVGGAGVIAGAPVNHWREIQIGYILQVRASSPLESFVYSGFDVTAGTGLSVNVAAGVAMTGGYLMDNSAADSLGSLTDNATNYIFLTLDFVDYRVDDFHLVANTTGVAPAWSVCLGQAVTAGGAITSVASALKKPRFHASSYTGTIPADQVIFLGFRPRIVCDVRYSGTEGTAIAFDQVDARSTWLVGDNAGAQEVGVDGTSSIIITDWGFTIATAWASDADHRWAAMA